MGDNEATKKAVRAEALRRREALSPEERAERSKRIAALVKSLDVWRDARSVLGYHSFGSEVETLELLKAALGEGKALALPRVNRCRKELELYWVKAVGRPYVEPGTWGIPEPVPEVCAKAALEEIDLVLVPGVAFDHRGGRIGYGGGYYDRLLSRLGEGQWAIGLAFEVQLFEEVPMGRLDRRVPILVTEERIIRTQ